MRQLGRDLLFVAYVAAIFGPWLWLLFGWLR
jgi:hypothetical protein